jgi:hypothetical protein
MVSYLESHGHSVVFHLEENIDLIFMIDPRPGDIGYSIHHIISYKQQYPNVKILHRVNENDARKNTQGMDELLLQASSTADSVIFISEWLQNYFARKGFSRDSKVIYNGCNLSHFYPKENVENNGRIKLVTHHWSDNWLKGFDLYRKIDEHLLENPNANFEFTYIGRYNPTYTPKATSLIPPLHGADLGNELRKHDIYVTASRREPCGMHHVEGAASGLPVIYHTECGGINELCKNHGEEYFTFKEFLSNVEKISRDLSHYRGLINYKNLDIEKCCESYYSEIRSLLCII